MTAVASGNRATGPKAAKLGWITINTPTNPTPQATIRRMPTCSPKKNLPISKIRNGSTNTMASASAIGINLMAAIKQKVAASRQAARTAKMTKSSRGASNLPPKYRQIGIIRRAWTTKRNTVISATGISAAASLAHTSRSGAMTQKPIIRATPTKGLSWFTPPPVQSPATPLS